MQPNLRVNSIFPKDMKVNVTPILFLKQQAAHVSGLQWDTSGFYNFSRLLSDLVNSESKVRWRIYRIQGMSKL